MYGYNSNFFSNNLMDSLRKATQRVALGEDVYRMDQFDTLDDERKRKLLQTQKAADAAERDPETGRLRVSGAISGVPDTEAGGDVYGVDPQGRAFFVSARKPKPSVAASTATSPTAAPTSTPIQSNLMSRAGGTDVRSALQARTVQGIQQAGLEADRQQRIARANEMTRKYGTIPGEGGTQVTRLQPDDIRPAPSEERKIVAPRAASGARLGALSSQVATVRPEAQAAFAAASDTPAARRIKERQRLARGGANMYRTGY